MSALGSLVVKLALDYAEYTEGLDRSDQAALKFAQQTQKNFDALGRSSTEFFRGVVQGAAQAVGAYFGIRAAINGLTESIDVLAKLDDASQKTGSSVENLSRIQKTLKAYGHSFDEFEPVLIKLAKGMATVDSDTNKVNKALDALGVKSKDAAGKLRDPSDVLLEAVKRLQGYNDSANKTALATDLLGKSGADNLPKLNDLAEGVGRFTGESKEAATNATLLQDRMNSVRGRVDEAFTSLAVSLMPTLEKVTDAMLDTAEGTSLFSKAGAFAKTIIEQLVITGAAAGFVFTTVGKTVSTAGAQLSALSRLDFRGVREAGSAWAADIAKDYEDYDKFVVGILTNTKKVEEAVDKLEQPKEDLVYFSGNDDAAKAAAQKIESLNEASRKFLETLKNETLGVDATNIQIKMLAAAKQAAITPSHELAMAIMVEAQAWAKLAQFQEETKEQFAALEAREDAYRTAANAIENYGRATDEANESAQFEIDLMGKSAIEREVALAQRRAELDLKKQILAITDQVSDAEDRAALIAEAEAVGSRAIEGARLQALARGTGDMWNQMWGTVEQTGKLAFIQLMGHGTSAFKSIGQALKTSVIDMLYQLVARPWIVKIGASISSSLAANAVSAATGGGGGGGLGTLGSILQGGQSIYSALSGGLTGGLSAAVSGLGSLFGSTAVSAFGAGLGMSSAAAAGAAGAYGAAGMASVGSAISMGAAMAAVAGPLAVAAIVDIGLRALAGDRVLGGGVGKITSYIPVVGPLLNLLFGTTPKKLGPAELTGNFSELGFSGEFQADWTRKVGLFGGQKRGRRGLGITDEQVSALNEMLFSLTDQIEEFVDYTGTAARSLAGWSFEVKRQIDTEEQRAQLSLDLAVSLAGKLAPELLTIQQKGESLIATLGRARAEFALTNSIIDLTGQTFGAVGLATLGLRDQLVQLLGGLDNAGAALQPYFDNFYTDAERTASGWRIINGEMEQLGIQTLPTTRDEFRALVEAQDLSTRAGQEMFAALIQLAPAFAELTNAAEQAKAAITLLTTDSFVSLVDYTRYIRLAANEGIGPVPPEVYSAAPSALAMGNVSANNAALLEQLRQLRAEQEAGSIAIAQNTARMAEVLSRWEGDGMPEVRSIAA